MVCKAELYCRALLHLKKKEKKKHKKQRTVCLRLHEPFNCGVKNSEYDFLQQWLGGRADFPFRRMVCWAECVNSASLTCVVRCFFHRPLIFT